jgi:hypothetical protein
LALRGPLKSLQIVSAKHNITVGNAIALCDYWEAFVLEHEAEGSGVHVETSSDEYCIVRDPLLNLDNLIGAGTPTFPCHCGEQFRCDQDASQSPRCMTGEGHPGWIKHQRVACPCSAPERKEVIGEDRGWKEQATPSVYPNTRSAQGVY